MSDFEKELRAQRISFSQREIRQEDAKNILSHQTEFFEKLKAVDTREKVHFLRSSKETIDTLIF